MDSIADIETPGEPLFYVFGTNATGWDVVRLDNGEAILNSEDRQEAVRLAEILEASRRYQGAFVQAERLFETGSRESFRNVSKFGGKSNREAFLMERFGIDEVQARELTNLETQHNLPADQSEGVKIAEFAGQPWADNAIGKINREDTQKNMSESQAGSELSNEELAVLLLAARYISSYRPEGARRLGMTEAAYTAAKDSLNAGKTYMRLGRLTPAGRQAVDRFAGSDTLSVAESRMKELLAQSAEQDDGEAEAWMQRPKEIRAMSNEDFLRAYRELEERNMRFESLYFLARRSGNNEQIREAQDLWSEYEQAGELTSDLSERRSALLEALEAPTSRDLDEIARMDAINKVFDVLENEYGWQEREDTHVFSIKKAFDGVADKSDITPEGTRRFNIWSSDTGVLQAELGPNVIAVADVPPYGDVDYAAIAKRLNDAVEVQVGKMRERTGYEADTRLELSVAHTLKFDQLATKVEDNYIALASNIYSSGNSQYRLALENIERELDKSPDLEALEVLQQRLSRADARVSGIPLRVDEATEALPEIKRIAEVFQLRYRQWAVERRKNEHEFSEANAMRKSKKKERILENLSQKRQEIDAEYPEFAVGYSTDRPMGRDDAARSVRGILGGHIKSSEQGKEVMQPLYSERNALKDRGDAMLRKIHNMREALENESLDTSREVDIKDILEESNALPDVVVPYTEIDSVDFDSIEQFAQRYDLTVTETEGVARNKDKGYRSISAHNGAFEDKDGDIRTNLAIKADDSGKSNTEVSGSIHRGVQDANYILQADEIFSRLPEAKQFADFVARHCDGQIGAYAYNGIARLAQECVEGNGRFKEPHTFITSNRTVANTFVRILGDSFVEGISLQEVARISYNKFKEDLAAQEVSDLQDSSSGGISAEEEREIRALSANPDEDVRYIQNAGGYMAILKDREMQRNAQDVLDSMISKRVVDVRNALRVFGWKSLNIQGLGGENQGNVLSKQGAVLDITPIWAPGEYNVVGYKMNGVLDELNLSAAEFARVVEKAALQGKKQEPQAKEQASDALVKMGTVYGDNVYVRQRDLDNDKRKVLPMYTSKGEPKSGDNSHIHRDNLDPDGSKSQARVEETKDLKSFEVLTAKTGKTFKTKAAAQREINRTGYVDTHEVVLASKVDPGASGYVGLRKGAELDSREKTQDKAVAFPTLPEKMHKSLEPISVRFANPDLGLPFADKMDTHIVMRATRPIFGTEQVESGEFAGGNFFVAIDPNDEFATQNIEQNKKLDAHIIMQVSDDALIDAYKIASPRYADKVEERRNDPDSREMVVDYAKNKFGHSCFEQIAHVFKIKPEIEPQNARREELYEQLGELEGREEFFIETAMVGDLNAVRAEMLDVKMQINEIEGQTIYPEVEQDFEDDLGDCAGMRM